ncbi:hypothetical protein Pint_27005 [Pistacia integerrima]|uniref:Uncharacterized protein n=1 Tax=Pistacia integerrima TaxID=434235 RepID=A0ACC0YQG6_9ROSI|nr:hypothetical protein Pint_27005 [Pistacia integerrima]
MIRLIKWKMMGQINQVNCCKTSKNQQLKPCRQNAGPTFSFEDSSQEQRRGGLKRNEKQKAGTENHWQLAGLLSKISEKQKHVLNQAGTIEDNRYAGAKMWG